MCIRDRLYLEDAIELTRHVVRKEAEWARRTKGPTPTRRQYGREAAAREGGGAAEGERDDEALSYDELRRRYGGYSAKTAQALLELSHDAVDYELLAQLVLHFMRTKGTDVPMHLKRVEKARAAAAAAPPPPTGGPPSAGAADGGGDDDDDPHALRMDGDGLSLIHI